jgi:hypothetical protein
MFTLLLVLATAAPQPALVQIPLGRELLISLGDDWTVRSYRNPAMSIPAVANAINYAQEVRLAKDNTFAMITVSDFKAPPNHPALGVSDIAPILQKVFHQNGGDAAETEIDPTLITNENIAIAYFTVHAKSDRQFFIGMGRRSSCWTSMIVVHRTTSINIDIGADNCESVDRKALVAAIAQIHE